MGLFDIFKAKRFRHGKVRPPTKFKVICLRCGRDTQPQPVGGFPAGTAPRAVDLADPDVTIEIPGRFQEPVIDLECHCGNGEIISP